MMVIAMDLFISLSVIAFQHLWNPKG